MIRPALAVLVGVLIAVAHEAAAQAICSAPHSSPVLANGGTIRTLPAGAGWFQVSGLRQVSTEFFGPGGERLGFVGGGDVRTHSVYVTAAVGIVRGVDLWGQTPIHSLSSDNQAGSTASRVGIGDPRLSVRIGTELFGMGEVPLSLRGGVKFPGSEFPVDATIVPLSEGQRDWELSLESGTALPGIPLYVVGWVGYRWREFNETTQRKPGDELFTHVAMGGRAGALHGEVALEVLRGRTPTQLGVELPSGLRELLQLQPTVGYGLGRGTLEATLLLPLAGQNLPAGPGGSVGYRFSWGGL
jgi:hypothetical protein